MPIYHNTDVNSISDNEFYSIDYEIIGLIFSIHRDMGRFWSEKIYQNELADRCIKSGFNNIKIEVPIQVLHIDFSKTYYADLIVENAIIYELKTAK